jgi:hypothetical protein
MPLDLIALPGFDQSHLAGAIVTWSLSGNTSHANLCADLTTAQISDHLHPKQCSPAVALRRAMSLAAGPHMLLRRIESGRWALVEERKSDDPAEPLDYRVVVQARLFGRPFIEPPAHHLGPAIIEEFDRIMDGTLSTQDLSGWLIDTAFLLQGIALKQAGGLYFLPTRALTKCPTLKGQTFVEIPAIKTEEVKDLVLRSMEAEAHQYLVDLETEINTNDDLGVRALRTRQLKTDEAINKVSVYETMLGQSMQGLQDAMQAMKARLMASILDAEARAEQEAQDKKARRV